MTSFLVSCGFWRDTSPPQGWSKKVLGLLRQCELYSHILSNSKARFGRSKSQVIGQELFFICIFIFVLFFLPLTAELWPNEDIGLAEIINSCWVQLYARGSGVFKDDCGMGPGARLTHWGQLSSRATWTARGIFMCGILSGRNKWNSTQVCGLTFSE